MKKVYIIALHLAFGGIEKAIISMANLFAERYDVEIISVYNMPGGPAFALDPRVKLRYLLAETPNREQWQEAAKAKNPVALARESVRSVRILRDKKQGVIDAIRAIDSGVVITTRPEDNVLLSRYGSPEVLKIAQLHRDHGYEQGLVNDIKYRYGNIDVLAMLTPGLAEEVSAMLERENRHTRVMYIPNFLESLPENVQLEGRERTVLSVGRLNAVKRFELLIEQFAEVHESAPDWKLRIVGEGEERGRLEKMIAERAAQSYVTLTGRLDAQQVQREMLSASLYAMTSSTEGFPFVLLEAQSCGLPVLAFDVRVGPGFVIQNGVNGYLVAEGSTGRFRERLLDLMRSRELRSQMAEAALRRAGEFSRERVRGIWYSVIGD